MKYDRHLDNSTTRMMIPNLVVTRLHEIWWWDVLLLSEYRAFDSIKAIA